MMQQMLALPELRDANGGLNFAGSGMIGTPLGASVIRAKAAPAAFYL